MSTLNAYMLSIISLSIEIVIAISVNQYCYQLLYTEISIPMYFFKLFYYHQFIIHFTMYSMI